MEVKPGYKQTEGGSIPQDWLDRTVGDLIRFEGGSQPDKHVFSPVSKPGFIRLIQIRDYKTDKFETYIPKVLARRFCTDNDIMIGRYGPPIFQILRGLSGAYNVALIKAIPDDEVSREFAYHFLTQEKLFAFVEKLSQRSSGQTGVDLKELRAFPMPLPPTREEQEAIAEALSDADALIESLEQLIAKKRQIKQGAMQELLTGQRRLPGFSGEWEPRQLGNVAEIVMGQSPDSKNYNRNGNGVPLIQGNADIENRRSISRVWTTQITKDGRAGDLLLTVRAPVGAVGRISERSCLGRGVCSLAPHYDVDFLFQALVFAEPAWKILEQGSTFTSANSTQVASFTVLFPPTKDEQSAIAKVLSEMDYEISGLETKLAKARQLKQAMMQELLTGRIRLV
jgi:type I restriction enzyme S subunit